MLKNARNNIRPMVSITVSEFNSNDIDEIFNKLTLEEGVDEITANIVREEGVYKINSNVKSHILDGYMKLIRKISIHKNIVLKLKSIKI